MDEQQRKASDTERRRMAERPEGFWPSFFRFWGALLWGKYPEDSRARKRATVGGIAMALLAIVGGVVVRGEARTDRMLADQRDDLRAAVQATRDLAEAVQTLALEARETRTTLLEKIPDATPAARPAAVKPIPARRRP